MVLQAIGQPVDSAIHLEYEIVLHILSSWMLGCSHAGLSEPCERSRIGAQRCPVSRSRSALPSQARPRPSKGRASMQIRANVSISGRSRSCHAQNFGEARRRTPTFPLSWWGKSV
jgi:hypothetical protein